MSFKGEFKVAGNTYEVIQCHVPLSQKYDQRGRPSSGVHSGRIRIMLDGTADGALGSWMADPTKKQDGQILFYRTDQVDTVFKEVAFEGAYLMTLIESFTLDNESSSSLLLETELINTDIGPDETKDGESLKNSFRDLLGCQQRTGRSYCMLLRISAEKIKIDGVEHTN
ncbi:type VI secretion system tube protein TssD [Xanthocytophaga agilis]|uniref:Type VI secretion system tube protein TssD n=1 Tax=Xanthocytophaga agilis TaxID=3048010 RepID=A0AAE3R3J1_9BACT|nr:type VI secretion system tube protein TssD [Xanthocytophaga agilis]MDJ1503001.1 type VI secretion system tube protein TssD [Xanthocytophaga agilis]